MPHYCQGALITCEDFRLHQRKDGRNYIAEFIKNLAIDCDLITRAGAVQDLVRPESRDFTTCLLRDTRVCRKLHEAEFVYLVGHEDCGAYSSLGFSTREEELNQHFQDLSEARKTIEANFPGTQVLEFFAYLQEGTEDVYEIKALKT